MTRYLLRNATPIKVASSGGVSVPDDDPSWLGMRREMSAAVVDEGSNFGGRPVAAHAIGYAGIRAAVEAGMHSIEHGDELDDELRHQMVQQGRLLAELGGLSPMQAIVAGTKTPAELCGVADTLGTVQVGKTADLVVVKAGTPVSDRGGFAVPSRESPQ